MVAPSLSLGTASDAVFGVVMSSLTQRAGSAVVPEVMASSLDRSARSAVASEVLALSLVVVATVSGMHSGESSLVAAVLRCASPLYPPVVVLQSPALRPCPSDTWKNLP